MYPKYFNSLKGLLGLAKVGIGMFQLILLGIIFLFLASALLMWLWNITITPIFNIRKITFWEAFRLILIAGLLFGGRFFTING